jgi:hypothetical protein
MKQLYILLTAFLFVFSNINAQTVTTVDPAGNWSAYMNWFNNDNGSKGSSAGGGAWGIADVKTTITDAGDDSYPNGAVTLQPNFGTYADGDAYWSDGSGGGNKWMEGISKIELKAGALGDTSLSFVGTVAANTLDNAYSAVAFIKTLDSNFATVIFETVVLGAAGSTFAVSASGIDAAHIVQYGFIVEGINANPANEAALGNVVVTPFTSGLEEEEPDYLTVTTDVSETWKGFISWFNNNNGAQGDYIAGQPWENINLVKTTITAAGDNTYPNGAIKLQPNFSLYADNENGDAAAQAYWLDGNGKGNKFLEGNSFVEYAAGKFTDGALKFVGNVEINDIYTEEYTVVAFIKTINATSFETVINKTVELGADGTSFEVKASGINSADIVQYGFSVRGLNANPTGETFLGGVTVTPNADFLPDEPTDAPSTPPARNSWDVISVYGEAYGTAIGLNNTDWDKATFADETIAGNVVLKAEIAGGDFVGADLGTKIDASEMTHFHIDYWIAGDLLVGQTMVTRWSNHAGANAQTSSFQDTNTGPDAGTWKSRDIEIDVLTGSGNGDFSRAELAQVIITLAAADGTYPSVIYIDNVYFYREATASINDLESNVNVYPNPVENTLNVSAAVVIDAVSIYDLTGREVMRAKPNATAFSLDVADLNKGLYLVTVKAGEQELNTKLVK